MHPRPMSYVLADVVKLHVPYFALPGKAREIHNYYFQIRIESVDRRQGHNKQLWCLILDRYACDTRTVHQAISILILVGASSALTYRILLVPPEEITM